MDIDHFDIVILGGGKGGKTLAMDQAKAGKRVALVEVGLIGGSCINIACIPSKALIRSAERAALVRNAPDFGVDVTGEAVVMPRVAARTAEVVRGMVALNQDAFDASGLELILGWGRFVEPRVIEVATADGLRRVTAERIYLDLGTQAAIPPIPGLAEASPMTHVQALRLEQIPPRLIIIGGGYIGLEMAQAFRRLGSEVAVLQSGSQIFPKEDEDVASEIGGILREEGVEIETDVSLSKVSGISGVSVRLDTADGRSFSGSHILVAAGRRPRTSDIGLDIAGVAVSEQGFIIVDEKLQTSVPGIWALGEAAGTPMFTHASLDDFRIAKSQIQAGSYTSSGRIIPYCLFVDPEFARVGLSERDAIAAGIGYRKVRIPLAAVPRARTMSATTGFMKCLLSETEDTILGFAMVGERAGEVMATVQIAMLAGLPFTALRDAIMAHPTMVEGLNLLFAGVQARREP